MKTLLLARHAKSDWNHPGLSDHDRPLNDRGVSDAKNMGEHLRQQNIIPDIIISSSAERAQQTQQLFLNGLNQELPTITDDTLYLCGTRQFLDCLSERTEDQVMIVAHNPGIEVFLNEITRQSLVITTANVAVIELNITEWVELEAGVIGTLNTLLRPKELFY